MLSYRHAFHAGNHADVLKHTVELLLLDYLNQKDKPYWYIDTHAGAGCYRLDEGYASKNAEFNTGIGPLWQRDDLPEPLARYVELVRDLNPDGELRFYPGSPFVAARAIRRDDKLRLFELHPTDGNILTENYSDAGRRAQVTLADGFAGLKSVLPPPPRRARGSSRSRRRRRRARLAASGVAGGGVGNRRLVFPGNRQERATFWLPFTGNPRKVRAALFYKTVPVGAHTVALRSTCME